MARIRSIKPEFFTSESIAGLPLCARLTFIGLWTYVDDNGVGLDNDRLIVAAVWPLENSPSVLRRTREDLRNLSGAALITRYASGRQQLLHIKHWDEHQKVSHPRQPRYPLPPEDLPNTPETLRPEQGAGSREEEQGAGSRDRRGTRLANDFNLTDEMFAWAHENAPGVNAARETEKFRDYWQSKSGAGATKVDWLATWRNWIRRASEQTHPRNKQQQTDEMFDRAMTRAAAREESLDPARNGYLDSVHSRALPAAGHG